MSRKQNAALMAVATFLALVIGVAFSKEPARSLQFLLLTSAPLFLIGFAALAAALATPIWQKTGWWARVTSALILPVCGVSAMIAGLFFDRLIAPLTVSGQIGAKLVPPLPDALASLLRALPVAAAWLLQNASLSVIVLIAAITVCEWCSGDRHGGSPG